MKNSKMIGPAILSVALLTIMAGAAVSPAVASIAEAFPGVGPSIIKLVITLPPLMVIPIALFAGKLSDVFGKKNVLLTGLILYLVSGLGGGFANTMEVLLICRALLGISVGLIMPLSTALVSDFFEGEAATRMMGLISSSNAFGGMASQLISGALAAFCWRYSFGAYGLAVIAIVLVTIYLPAPPKEQKITNAPKTKLPLTVYLYACAAFILMLVFYTIPVNLALFVDSKSMGSPASSGAALALITGASFIVGIYFQRINSALNSITIVASIALIAGGLGILHLAGGIHAVFIGVICIGIGQGYLMPLLLQSVRIAVNIKQSVSAMAVVTSMLYLGQFSSPIIMDGLGKLWTPMSHGSPFFIPCCLSIAAAGLALIHVLFIKKNTEHTLKSEEI